uniref:NAC family transcription factor 9 n=1 Tax=Larix gmelinii var. olgensis TaxID=188928 RepID=A0AA50A928_9CONI|nr:NAC family transcription factor 9 [Larix gmelinii var. olgensis]
MLDEVYDDEAVQEELTVTPGFRFYPTEEELVGFYLRRRVQAGGHPLNFDIIIPTLDLYRYDPWELSGFAHDAGEIQWFFFVPRDHKKSCPRPNRLTVSGYWKATGSDRTVRNELLQCIGLKKFLVFYKGKGPSGQKTDWIMNEYRMPDLNSSANKMKDIVLCRIYRKARDKRARPNPVEKEEAVVSGDKYEENSHSTITLKQSSIQ